MLFTVFTQFLGNDKTFDLFVELFGFDFLEVVPSLVFIKNVALYTLVVAACSLPVTLLVRKLLHPKQPFLPKVKG